MTIKVGDKLPAATFSAGTAEGPKPMTTDEIFAGKKVALFAVPGAFTPTCSARHLPGYVDNGAALKAKPGFRLMIGTGYYDTTTTIGPARYLKSHGVLPADRVVLHDYEGGHMAYTNEDALKAFSNDVRAFVTGR